MRHYLDVKVDQMILRSVVLHALKPFGISLKFGSCDASIGSSIDTLTAFVDD